MSSTLSWAAAYIGKPWRADAEGPDAYDCKGLVREVQRRHFGREVPALQVADTRTAEGRAAFMEAVRRSAWKLQPPGTRPAEGDILVAQGADGAHVGSFLVNGRRLGVLHAQGHTDAKGIERGAVRWDELRDLLACGYSRPELWRWQP
jgi:cell wall-associated NlpC family hydrolase